MHREGDQRCTRYASRSNSNGRENQHVTRLQSGHEPFNASAHNGLKGIVLFAKSMQNISLKLTKFI